LQLYQFKFNIQGINNFAFWLHRHPARPAGGEGTTKRKRECCKANKLMLYYARCNYEVNVIVQ